MKILKQNGNDIQADQSLKRIVKALWSIQEILEDNMFPDFLDVHSKKFLHEYAKWDLHLDGFKNFYAEVTAPDSQITYKEKNQREIIKEKLNQLSQLKRGLAKRSRTIIDKHPKTNKLRKRIINVIIFSFF